VPSETRNIVFSQNELLEAIGRYVKHVRHPMPAGKITRCHIEPDGNVSVIVDHNADGSNHVVEFSHAMVAAALIRFCIEKSIPIPRKSEKTVHGEADGMALNFRIEPQP